MGHASGGNVIVYELARRLTRDGYQVGLFYLSDVNDILKQYLSKDGSATIVNGASLTRYIRLILPFLPLKDYGGPKSNSLAGALDLAAGNITMNTFNSRIGYYLLLPFLRKLLKIGFGYDMRNLRGVRILFGREFDKSLVSERVVVQGFPVALHLSSHRTDPKTYYLIQAFEDDPAVSGNLYGLAAKSLELPLKKIVVNKELYKAYLKDRPLFFTPGFDSNFFRVLRPIERRDPKSVLVQLMKGKMKGASYGIDAMEYLKKDLSDVTIRAFGNLERSMIPHHIEFHLLPSKSELQRLYNMSSVFVSPSVREGFGLPVLEAMHSGCAVVTFDNGGVNEYLRDNFNGIIVRTIDSNSLKNAIAGLIQDSPKRLVIARNGYQTSAAYSYGRMYHQFAQAIKNYESNLAVPYDR